MPANAPATHPSGQLPSGSWLYLLLRCAPQKDAAAIPHAEAKQIQLEGINLRVFFLLLINVNK
jgi:hypothetical protein